MMIGKFESFCSTRVLHVEQTWWLHSCARLLKLLCQIRGLYAKEPIAFHLEDMLARGAEGCCFLRTFAK